ncbi:hypothetical protein GXM_02245 [Nostoc sphaeroides CCNUC1]|uniref:Uncharacterized protein n=1 Tax=Nostoc sphaeroides CCNUC1 TaxID=2653204 RepID=A0A5P8VWK7_9NOSO|nr:hypothetical protein GXM_02245 [Nostoc sphaeroides CCNUC1]
MRLTGKYCNVLYKLRKVNKQRQTVAYKRRDIFYEWRNVNKQC